MACMAEREIAGDSYWKSNAFGNRKGIGWEHDRDVANSLVGDKDRYIVRYVRSLHPQYPRWFL